MSYFLYQLQFDTPVHFGTAEEGGKLEQAGLTCHADTLFSALCSELAEQGENAELQAFIEQAKQGKIRFSDLMPYSEADGDMHYYLPKPIFPAKQVNTVFRSLQEHAFYLSEQKKMEQASFLRVTQLKPYLSTLQKGSLYPLPAEPVFGQMQMMERVNCRQEGDNLPYFVKSFTFAPNCGLYGILYLANDDDLENIQAIIESLGLTGIGGKRSSGYGKFQLLDDAYDLSESFYEDDKELFHFLQQQKADWQISLSIVLPQANEIDTLSASWYRLLRRSGFIANAVAQQKRDSVYMLSPGSCLAKRLHGSIAVVGKNAGHEVLRYGLGMYAGVTL